MDIPIGRNHRFINENLFLGKQLKADGFGAGQTGLDQAKEAALQNKGSELIYQNEKGHWFAQEIGEAASKDSQLKPLSQIDQSEIRLDVHTLKANNYQDANISFADDKAAATLPSDLSQLSSWQKLKIGNQAVLSNIASKAGSAISHPVRTVSDLATGLVSNTLSTLKNPGQAWAQTQKAYEQDRIEGMITGVRSFGAVVASAALVTGAAAAVVSLGAGRSSFQLGKSLTVLEKTPGVTLEAILPVFQRAQTISVIGAHAGRLGATAGQIGKIAGTTLVAATGASFIKNQYDLSQSKTQAEMAHEVQQLTQDSTSLAQSAVFFLANDILTDIGKIAKRLYTENRHYAKLSPEANQFLDQMLTEKSQKIAQRAAKEIPDLHPAKWKHLDLAKQEQALQSLNRIIGEELDFTPAALNIKDLGPDLAGGYHFENNQVFVHSKLMGQSPMLVNTLTHEQFHAFQSALIKTFKDQNKHKNPLLQTHIDSWRNNQSNYASPTNTPFIGKPGQEIISRDAMGLVFPGFDNSIEYRNQPLESGAWSIGNGTEAAFKQIVQPVANPLKPPLNP